MRSCWLTICTYFYKSSLIPDVCRDSSKSRDLTIHNQNKKNKKEKHCILTDCLGVYLMMDFPINGEYGHSLIMIPTSSMQSLFLLSKIYI